MQPRIVNWQIGLLTVILGLSFAAFATADLRPPPPKKKQNPLVLPFQVKHGEQTEIEIPAKMVKYFAEDLSRLESETDQQLSDTGNFRTIIAGLVLSLAFASLFCLGKLKGAKRIIVPAVIVVVGLVGVVGVSLGDLAPPRPPRKPVLKPGHIVIRVVERGQQVTLTLGKDIRNSRD